MKRGLIYICGKGSKYRALNPAKHLLEGLEKYIRSFLPKEYLIVGQGDGKYSGSSIENVVKRAAEKAGLRRHIHSHMLRHTFAAHHMEKGTELRLIRDA